VCAATPFASAAPQSPQNRFSGGFAPPQLAQISASALPQLPQKRFPAGLSVPQLGQEGTDRA
jgi:hypothetical protein